MKTQKEIRADAAERQRRCRARWTPEKWEFHRERVRARMRRIKAHAQTANKVGGDSGC